MLCMEKGVKEKEKMPIFGKSIQFLIRILDKKNSEK